MSVSLVDVTFMVKGHTRPGEVMCVVGDCPILGEWDPQHAQVMVPEGHTEDEREIWSKLVPIPRSQTIHYRYLIAKVNEADKEGDSRDITVMWWETNHTPRKFNFVAWCQNPQGSSVTDAEFGYYEGKQSIDKGWLICQTEIHLRLHSNPIYMWKSRHRQQTYRVKCTAFDITSKDLSMDDEESDLLPMGDHNKVTVSLYDGEQDVPSEQPQFGTVFMENDYMLFRLHTFDRESLGYQFDFYVHDPNGGPDQAAKHIGSSFFLPKNLKEMHGISEMSITGLQNKPIGHLTVDYLIVSPLTSVHCDMRVSFARHWKFNRRPLDVGHRGMGSSYGSEPPLKECESVEENTIHSLSEAGGHGADFVEFDVQLTKDKVPVIYHDLKVSLTLKKKHSEELEWFDIPVNELNLEQLQMLKLDHPSEKSKGNPVSSLMSPTVAEEERRLFPTLRRCFELLDPHIGFLLEVKYCMQLKTGEREEDLKHFLERNEYIDIILTEVLKHGASRRIILHSFDPDICTMMRVKQNLYPVMFNPLGGTSLWTPYNDVRCGRVDRAEHYAHGERLLGLNVHTEDILKDHSLIAQAKKHNMVLFCWGADLNSKENIKRLKEMGVDGVIYDRIHELKDTKENVFKMEKDEKLKLLRTVGAITKNGSHLVTTTNSQDGAVVGSSCSGSSQNGEELVSSSPAASVSPSSLSKMDTEEETQYNKAEIQKSCNGALNGGVPGRSPVT